MPDHVTTTPDHTATDAALDASVADVRRHVAEGTDAFVDRLAEWLRIPSVSADPDRASDVRRSAEWLADELRAAGFPTVEVWDTGTAEAPGLPSVFAEWPSDDPGAPTALVYGHHDVQPAERDDGWHTEPFEPVRDGDLLRGRGACDDKGQVLMHLLGLRAHLAATDRTSPATSLKVVVEGEEESGSLNFPALLAARRDRLAADVVVVSDTGLWSAEVPTTVTAMRGHVDCQVDFYGPEEDIHSGSFGGAVRNPLHELVALLAGLHDSEGRVTIPGFYDDVAVLDETERQLFAKLPFDEERWLSAALSTATHGETGYSTLERVWARPTAEINGVYGGYTGAGYKTIIPKAAHAKLSFRLVADQDPVTVVEQVRRWVAASTPEGIRSSVSFGAGGRPCSTPWDDPAVEVLRGAMAKAFGTEVLIAREGGSGPEADLAEVIGAPVVFLGVGLPDDRFHGPDERVRIPMLAKGAEAAAHLWSDLVAADLPRRAGNATA